MLQYDRIDILEGTGINKTHASEECDICHYCFFQVKLLIWTIPLQLLSWFKQKAMNFSDLAIFCVKGSDYRIRFWYMSKWKIVI